MFSGNYGDYSKQIPNVTLPAADASPAKSVAIEPLNDDNVMARLEKASELDNANEIDECLDFITTFNNDNISTSFEKYFHYFEKLQGPYEKHQKRLHAALFEFVHGFRDLTWHFENGIKEYRRKPQYAQLISVWLSQALHSENTSLINACYKELSENLKLHNFDEVTRKMTPVAKRDAVIVLIKIKGSSNEVKIETIRIHLELINRLKLHHDPEVQKAVMELFACEKTSNEFKQELLMFVRNNFPKIHDEKPEITLLRNYLSDVPYNKKEMILKLLQFARHNDSRIMMGHCLRAMERHDASHYIPDDFNLAFDFCLQDRPPEEVGRLAEYVQIPMNPWNEEIKSSWIPKVLLLARAPQLDPIANPSERYQAVHNDLIKFILSPFSLKIETDSNLPRVARQYAYAEKIGCAYFKHKVEVDILWKKVIAPEDIKPLLSIFKRAKGEFKEDLKSILLAHACLIFKEDPKTAKKIARSMIKRDPQVFSRVDMYPVIGRVKDFKNFRKDPSDESPAIDAAFVRTLKELAPKIETMDFRYVSIEEGTLKEIGNLYPELITLYIDCPRCKHVIANELFQLKFQHLYLSEMRYWIREFHKLPPVKSLIFYDFIFTDRHIEEMLKDHQNLPEWFKTLETLRFQQDVRVRNDTLSSKNALLLVKHMPKLRCVNFDEVDDCEGEILDMPFKEYPDLTSFSACLYLRNSLSLEQLNVFPLQLNELGLNFGWLGSSDSAENSLKVAKAISSLKGLKSLRLHKILEKKSLEKIVEDHLDLERLDISENYKITDDCIPALLRLQGLRKLNIGRTNLSRDGILKVVEGLPHLEQVVIQLKKTFHNEEDESIILNKIRLRKGLEVKIIKPFDLK